MKVTLFGGAYITEDETKAIIDIDYRPPAGHADIISLIYNDRPDIIILSHAVIPGISVWHTELLEAMNLGVRVYGTGGLGAVRAAELSSFGMIGIGEVFRQYKAGEIEDDDEVYFRSDGFGDHDIRLSEPIVNLRATLKPAVSDHIISENDFQNIIHIAKEIYYEDRTVDNIFSLARERGFDTHLIHKLGLLIQNHYIDQQKLDTIETLKQVSRLKDSDLDRELPPRHEYDLFFDALYERDRKVKTGNTQIPLYTLSDYLSLHYPEMESLSSQALNRQIVAMLASVVKINLDDAEIMIEEARFRKKYNLTDDNKFAEWLKNNDISKDDFFVLMKKNAEIKKVQAWFSLRLGFKKNTRHLLEELLMKNEYYEWKLKCANRQRLLEDCIDEIGKNYNEKTTGELLKEFIQKNKPPWNVPVSDYLEEVIMSPSTFHLELAKEKAANDVIKSLAKKLL